MLFNEPRLFAMCLAFKRCTYTCRDARLCDVAMRRVYDRRHAGIVEKRIFQMSHQGMPCALKRGKMLSHILHFNATLALWL